MTGSGFRGEFKRRDKLLPLASFGALLVLLLAGVAITVGVGRPSSTVPPGVAAVIEDVPPALGTITMAELDQEIRQLAGLSDAEHRLKQGDREYDQLAEQALGSLITAIWLRGQAEELGVAIDRHQVAIGLRGEEAKYLRESGYTRKTIEERVILNLAMEGTMERLGERARPPTAEEARLYYEEEGLDEKGSFADRKDEIESLLEQQKKQEIYSEVDIEFPLEWQLRTKCAKDFVLEKCYGFPSFARLSGMPPACYEEEPREPAEDCPAPVTGRSVALPGTVQPWQPEGDRRVQRPVPPGGGEIIEIE